MKSFITFLTLCFVLLLAPLSAFAQSTILFVSPSRVQIASDENIASINVANQSEEERRYDLTVVDQVMNEDGLTSRKETFDYSAKRMLRFVPKRFTLKPGERQIVRVMARRPQDLPDGDYHSHLLFREVPLGQKSKADIEAERSEQKVQFEIRALYGIAVPVIVQKGAISSDIDLGNAYYVPASDGAPAHLAVELERSGNAEGAGRLYVEYVPGEGGEPVEVTPSLWIPIYREVDTLTKRIPLANLPEGVNLSSGKIVLTLVEGADKREDEGAVLTTKDITF